MSTTAENLYYALKNANAVLAKLSENNASAAADPYVGAATDLYVAAALEHSSHEIKAYEAQQQAALGFDPADLIHLCVGYSAKAAISLEHTDFLVSVARLLDRLWRELVPDGDYPGVFAYEVSEPLGERLALLGDSATLSDAEAVARTLILDGLGTAECESEG